MGTAWSPQHEWIYTNLPSYEAISFTITLLLLFQRPDTRNNEPRSLRNEKNPFIQPH
jgi:hypothetical protein